MSRAHDILNEIEEEYDVKFDANFQPEGLCQDTHCIHDECSCWRWFRDAAEAEAQRMVAVEVQAAYNGSECTLSSSCECRACRAVYSPTNCRGADAVL